MTPDLILIPTYFRPEFLYLCLEHILNAEGGRDCHVIVLHDHHIGETFDQAAEVRDMAHVRDSFADCFSYFYIYERPPHGNYGPTLSIFEGYREALKTDAERIYMIQDDVLVAPDFFRWNRTMQRKFPDCFCSIGWRNMRWIDNDSKSYLRSEVDYSSIGVCWPRQTLEEIVKHSCTEYYSNPITYIANHFPNNPVPPTQWTEEDGIIKRMLLQPGAHHTILWPTKERCAHVGITGYHRTGVHFRGSMPYRVEALRAAAQSTATISSMTNEDYGAPDIHSLAPYTPWSEEELYEAQHFPNE